MSLNMENMEKGGKSRGKILGGLTLLSIVVGLYWGLIVAPPETGKSTCGNLLLPLRALVYPSFILRSDGTPVSRASRV